MTKSLDLKTEVKHQTPIRCFLEPDHFEQCSRCSRRWRLKRVRSKVRLWKVRLIWRSFPWWQVLEGKLIPLDAWSKNTVASNNFNKINKYNSDFFMMIGACYASPFCVYATAMAPGWMADHGYTAHCLPLDLHLLPTMMFSKPKVVRKINLGQQSRVWASFVFLREVRSPNQ